MFTGIVELVGSVRAVHDLETTRRFTIDAPGIVEELDDGDSVAVDGCCMTVTGRGDGAFSVDAIGTTLARTAAAGYGVGSRVNLERALRMDGRIDGHLVQGHIDGVGHFMDKIKDGEFWLMSFELPEDVAHATVPRGSVALNGVSLTVAELEGRQCRVGIIPFTYAHTNLGALRLGDRVNVEGDLIGKYVGRMLAQRLGSGA